MLDSRSLVNLANPEFLSMHPLVLVVIALVFWANAHRPIVAAPPDPIAAACSSDDPRRSEAARILNEVPAQRSWSAAWFDTDPKWDLLAPCKRRAGERSASS